MFASVEFDELHRRTFPAEHHALAAAAAVGLTPLAFRVPDGRAYTFVPRASRIDVVAGVDGAATIVALPLEVWERSAAELGTPYGLLVTGDESVEQGADTGLQRW